MAQYWVYVWAIPAAIFLINGLPHFLHGVSGEPFPTPFVGGPPNLDGPTRNVLWGGLNLIVGGAFLAAIWPALGNPWLLGELLVVAMAAAIGTSRIMSRKTPRT